MNVLDPAFNGVEVTVSTGYDDTATTIVLSASEGAKLPNPSTDGNFNLVYFNSTDYKRPFDDPNVEIIRVTGISTDTLTVVRPAAGNNYNGEGSGNTAKTHNTGGKNYKMILSVTRRTIEKIDTELIAKLAKTPNVTSIDDTGIADGEIAIYDLTNKKIKTSDKVFSTDGTLAGNSDSNVATEKAVKTYADTKASKTVSAAARVRGRKTAGSGDVEELTLSEVLDFIGSAASGDILYRGASAWARLAKGSDGQVLTLASGLPAWGNSFAPKAYVRTSNFSTTSSSYTDVTGIAHAAEANKKYRVSGQVAIAITGGGTESIILSIPSGYITGRYSDNAGNSISDLRVAGMTAITYASASTVTYSFDYLVEVGASAGDIKLQIKTSDGTSTAYAATGTKMIVQEVL
jgi:hypothetical protein